MDKQKMNKLIPLMLVMILALLVLSGCVFTPPEESGIIDPGQSGGTIPTINVETATPAPTQASIAVITSEPTSAVIQLITDTPAPVNTVPQSMVTATATPTFTVVTPSPSPTPASLKLGAQGEAVRTLQTQLKKLGFYTGTVDGDYGSGTEAAVKAFQKQYGLTVDGKAGSKTLSVLATASNTKKPTATPTPKYSPTPRPTATPKAGSYSNTYLRKGDSGTKVKEMQTRLISLGYLSGKATGKFDDTTEKAVIAFQKRNCSYSDGVAGPDTLSALYSSSARKATSSAGTIGVSYRNGDSGDQVKAIQTKLKQLGYFTGTATGTFGTQTEEAVRAFQKKNGLTADGIVGDTTLAKMYSSSALSANQTATPKKTATPKPTATKKPTATPTRKVTATPKHTATPPPNTYVRVTKSPTQKYITLYEGNYGDPVITLQQALKKQGYFYGEVDGYYGELTTAAVKNFQKAKGLTQDGVAGFATQTVLFEGDFPDES